VDINLVIKDSFLFENDETASTPIGRANAGGVSAAKGMLFSSTKVEIEILALNAANKCIRPTWIASWL